MVGDIMKLKTTVFSTQLFILVLILFLPIQSGADYTRYRMTIVENGGFEISEPNEENLGAYWVARGPRGALGIPEHLVVDINAYEGQYCLSITPGDSVWQHLPGVQEYADSLVIRGAIKLTGYAPSARLILTSGDGKSVVYCMEPNPTPPQDDPQHTYIDLLVQSEEWTTFTIPAGLDFLNAFGINPLPRFTLMLIGISGRCLFDAFEITTDFYTLSPEELKEKILDEMEWTFDIWIERGLDVEGPEHTPCVSHLHDAITGEEVQTQTLCPVWASYPFMIDYLRYRENEAYRQLVVDQADLFLRTRHRTTGFMHYWNPATDQPTGNVALFPLSYLWKVYDFTGDAKYRDAAIELTDSVLAFAERAWDTEPIPEGYLQSGYLTDGTVKQLHEHQYDIMIRWFDIVRFLAEAYERYPDPHYLEAMEQCAELYITPGVVDYADVDPLTIDFVPTWYDWHNLIPAFDDYFGYGIQGLWMTWEAGGFSHEGIKAYLDKAFADMGGEWWKAMLKGGREAGDESRGWAPYFWSWQYDPNQYSDHRDYLVRNGYTVMKGEFGEYGSWMGTGYEHGSPIIGLPGEGGTTGASGNALMGFYEAWEASGRNEDFYAAMVSLFRTSQLTYKFDYGYIRTPFPDLAGPNIAGGEFRYINGWFDILEALGFTDVEQSHEFSNSMPKTFDLYQNYPNPFNGETIIPYELKHDCFITITILDGLGRRVRILKENRQPAGYHSVVWDGTSERNRIVASGLYFCEMKTRNLIEKRKILFIK
jgi:hypothetical protein